MPCRRSAPTSGSTSTSSPAATPWDAKIRQQVQECTLFIPVISATTNARLEAYFRIEWNLAGHRTHAMAGEKAFLLPVVVDDTRDTNAIVPAEFKAIQWTRPPDGADPAAFARRVSKLLAGAPLRLAIWAAVGAALLALGAGAVYWSTSRPEAAASTMASTTAESASIAVLPFTNLSSDKEQEYFSDGLSEELLNLLAKLPQLRVIARSSSFSFKGKATTCRRSPRRCGLPTSSKAACGNRATRCASPRS